MTKTKNKKTAILIACGALAVIIAAVAIVCVLVFKPAGNQPIEGITRSRWIAELYRTIMKEDPDGDVLRDIGGAYVDVPVNAVNYHQIQSAVNYNWLQSELTDRVFHPERTATREFVAVSAVRAAGYQAAFSEEQRVAGDVYRAVDTYGAIMAVNLGLLDLDASRMCRPDEPADEVFVQECKDFVLSELADADKHADTVNVAYRDGVRDSRDALKEIVAYADENALSLSMPADMADFEPGDIVLLPGTVLYPEGVARKIDSVTREEGTAIVQCSEAAVTEVFDELDVAMSLDINEAGFSFYQTVEGDDAANGSADAQPVVLDGTPGPASMLAGNPTGSVLPLSYAPASQADRRTVVGVSDLGNKKYNIFDMEVELDKREIDSKTLNEVIRLKRENIPVDFSLELKNAVIFYNLRYSQIADKKIPLSIKCTFNYDLLMTLESSARYDWKTDLVGIGVSIRDMFSVRLHVPLAFHIEGEIKLEAKTSGRGSASIGLDGFSAPVHNLGKINLEAKAVAKASVSTGLRFELSLLGARIVATGYDLTVGLEAETAYYFETEDYCADVTATGNATAYYRFIPEAFDTLTVMFDDAAEALKERYKQVLDDAINSDDVQAYIDYIRSGRLTDFFPVDWWGWNMADHLEVQIDKLRAMLVKEIDGMLDGYLDKIKASVKSVKDFFNADKQIDVQQIPLLHYEGHEFKSFQKVPVCTRAFEITVEEPAELRIGETKKLVVQLTNKELKSAIPLPYSVMKIEVTSGKNAISLDAGTGGVTGMEEGKATIRVTRLLTDAEGKSFESNVRTNFTITVSKQKLLAFSPQSATVAVNERYTPQLFMDDGGGSREPVSLSSEDIELVYSSGLKADGGAVYLGEAGGGTLRARWKDGSASATFSLTAEGEDDDDKSSDGTDVTGETSDTTEPDRTGTTSTGSTSTTGTGGTGTTRGTDKPGTTAKTKDVTTTTPAKSSATTTTPAKGGDGTASNPFMIYTAADLQRLADGKDGWYGQKHFKLANNITAPNNYNCDQFQGTFDGAGYTITVNYTGPEKRPSRKPTNGGVFRYVDYSATIKNLNVAGIVNSYDTVGGIVGYNAGLIENCTSSVTVTGPDVAGGIVGDNSYRGQIINCHFKGTVNGKDGFTGGIAGSCTQGKVQGCTTIMGELIGHK